MLLATVDFREKEKTLNDMVGHGVLFLTAPFFLLAAQLCLDKTAPSSSLQLKNILPVFLVL